MEIICEKDCKSCWKEDCPQRRCPPAPMFRNPEKPILKEENPSNFDWSEGPKANLVE